MSNSCKSARGSFLTRSSLPVKGVESLQKRRIVDCFERLTIWISLGVSLSASGFVPPRAAAASNQVDVRDERDPAKRSEKFLEAAEAAFDNARAPSTKDDVHKGDAELDEMVSTLNNCVSALGNSHKSRLYKKAEMRVSYLQRR